MFRPVGALLFGLLGDRFGRRYPLMADILLFSAMELASGFAPNFRSFVVIRAIFGLAMGGEWGLGAALTMEVLPPEARGYGLIAYFLKVYIYSCSNFHVA